MNANFSIGGKFIGYRDPLYYSPLKQKPTKVKVRSFFFPAFLPSSRVLELELRSSRAAEQKRMAKFNEVQKRRRALAGERKRAVHGDALTGKLKNKQQPLSISGKRKRKLFKQWRREQKEALQKGLVTMQDVEMAVAEGETATSDETSKTPKRFHVKKSLKLKQLKRGGRGKKKQSKAKSATEAPPLDSMVE